MSISVGNLSRVSNSLRTYAALSQLRSNSMRLFRQEQQISSGRQILSVGDDPVASEKIARMLASLEGQDQILTNLQYADNYLASSDQAVTEVSDLLIDAARIASEQAGSFSSAEERAAQAVVIDGIIDQLMNVGNRQFQGLYLFGGRRVKSAPLSSSLGRIANFGDLVQRSTLVDQGTAESYGIAASSLFGLRESVTGGYAGFDVQLSTDVRLTELDGAVSAGIRLGSLSVTDGAINFQVDLTEADTLQDVIAKFDAAATAAGSTATLGINPADGATLLVTNGGPNAIQIEEVGQGTTAADLGIRKSAGAGADIVGDNVHRRVMPTTKLTDLAFGGITLLNGVVVTNGSLTATVTFTGATTVQEVLNRLNNAHVGIRASINAAGDGIEIENQISGSPLVVGENGGTDAETLGIRTLDMSVSVSRLNGYRGIHPVTGNDIRITNAAGTSFEVDLSGVQTLADIKTAIEAASAAAGAGITVETTTGGAGLRLNGPGGAGLLTVEAINLSPVAAELGIEGTGTATTLEGDNVGQFYQTGIFSALYRLRDGLLADDSSEITEAGSQINAWQQYVVAAQGEIGARSRSMQLRVEQTQDAVEATKILLSQMQDVDYTEAITRFQQAQTALQASLLAGSQTLNLSLLDFLQ